MTDKRCCANTCCARNKEMREQWYLLAELRLEEMREMADINNNIDYINTGTLWLKIKFLLKKSNKK